jgi:hypothetical protein
MGQLSHRNYHFLVVITLCAPPASLMASRSVSITHEGGPGVDPAMPRWHRDGREGSHAETESPGSGRW